MILEEILADIGDAGRFQVVFTAVILTMEVVAAWSMLQTAIVGATPDWWCVDPATFGTANMTLDNSTFQQCSAPVVSTIASNGHLNGAGNLTDLFNGTMAGGPAAVACVRYFDPAMISIISEWNVVDLVRRYIKAVINSVQMAGVLLGASPRTAWDVVCERRYIKAVINSVQMAGVLVGSVLSGQSSDTFGRRITCYVTILLHAVTCLVAGLSTAWEMYAVLRFFVGAAIGSYLVLHYVYVIEFVRPTWRPYLSSVPSWALGAGMMCLTAWQVPHWRYLHYICAAITLPMLLGWFVSPESLRWLAAKGRVEAAEKVVDQIARFNGRSKAADVTSQLSLLAEEEKNCGEAETRYTYTALFRGGWKNVMKTLVIGFAWMSLSMSFYGIIFGVSALTGNVYLNMFLLSVVEVPLTLATSCLTIYFGRRWTASVFFFLASLTGFAILIVDRTASEEEKGSIISAVAICSKLFIAAAWCTMQTFTTELYPTVIRSLGLGAANTAARVGGILAPFVLEMESSDDAVKCYVIVGSLMAISGLSVLLLGETKGKALADTMHQEQKEMNI